jgi:Na+/serine symporter
METMETMIKTTAAVAPQCVVFLIIASLTKNQSKCKCNFKTILK